MLPYFILFRAEVLQSFTRFLTTTHRDVSRAKTERIPDAVVDAVMVLLEAKTPTFT